MRAVGCVSWPHADEVTPGRPCLGVKLLSIFISTDRNFAMGVRRLHIDKKKHECSDMASIVKLCNSERSKPKGASELFIV